MPIMPSSVSTFTNSQLRVPVRFLESVLGAERAVRGPALQAWRADMHQEGLDVGDLHGAWPSRRAHARAMGVVRPRCSGDGGACCAPEDRAAEWPTAGPACRRASARLQTSSAGPVSTTSAAVHHGDPVAHVADDADVVADEDEGESELVLQVHQQVEHLRAQRHVERRGRFVGDDDARVERDRAGDADALTLAAGKGVRIALAAGGLEPDLGAAGRRPGRRARGPWRSR